MRYTPLFLPHLGGSRAHLADLFARLPTLEAILAGFVEAGRAAWPDVPMSDEVFLRHLAERLPVEGDGLDVITDVHASDLYLACGCTFGEPTALAAFETQFLSAIPRYFGRSDAESGLTDELKQALRTRLLISEGGQPPKIAGYTGRGPLAVWLRITAARLAVNLRKQRQRGAADEEQALWTQAPAHDPELRYLKSLYQEDFAEAFRSTLASLTDREANVLRLYFLEQMTAESIAVLYVVSERTVQRWIVTARQRILDETRRLLGARLRLPASELDSVLDLLRSELDVSIGQLLKKNRR